VGPRRLSHPSEGTKIRSLASHCQVEILLTDEASDAAEELDITRPDLLAALRNCSVVESRRRGSQWLRVVKGTDIDGLAIIMTVTVVYQVRRILVLEIERES
jgi:hypothetical protein